MKQLKKKGRVLMIWWNFKNISVPFLVLVCFLSCGNVIAANDHQDNTTWEAGSAAVDITPEGSLWMAGYAARISPTDKAMHKLWVKALVLKDQNGHTSVMISSDLVGIPKSSSDKIRKTLKDRFGLDNDQIMLNSSHTHSGPYLYDAFRPSTFTKPEKELEKIKVYTGILEDKVVRAVETAMDQMEPAQLFSGNGTARFQVNRRNNSESQLALETDLNGPNDYAVPVLKVANREGEIKTILYGYACHATVLNGYEWSGDYPGFAQVELDKAYPNATNMFFQGCGGDQNPLPRRSKPLAVKYGKELAAAVQEVLKGDMEKLGSNLKTSYQEISLPLSSPPDKEELAGFLDKNENKYFDIWARFMLDKLDSGEKLIESYPYPVQVWQMGDQNVVSLGGEVVIEYAINIKRLLGRETFVFAYSNDGNCAYIPTAEILEEGGYEGKTSQYHKGFPSVWEPAIEYDIVKTVLDLANSMGINSTQRSLTD